VSVIKNNASKILSPTLFCGVSTGCALFFLFCSLKKENLTKNQSRQDPLNYGIRINNRLAFLLADSQRGDFPPTDQSKEFFNDIKKELDIEINALNDLMKKSIETINEKVTSDKIPMISLK